MAYSPEQIDRARQVIALREAAITYKANHKREFAPEWYPWQQAMFSAGATHRERLVLAGNRCITPWTLIETPSGERPASSFVWAGGDVLSWDGERQCTRTASPAFLKSIEPAFLVLLDNGRAFQSSGKHRVLTVEGWLSLWQLVQRANGLRYSQTHAGYSASYDGGARQCDPPPLRAEDSGQALPPSPADARPRHPIFDYRDAEAHIDECIRACRVPGPQPTSDGPDLLAALCDQWIAPDEKAVVQYTTGLRRACLLSHEYADRPIEGT